MSVNPFAKRLVNSTSIQDLTNLPVPATTLPDGINSGVDVDVVNPSKEPETHVSQDVVEMQDEDLLDELLANSQDEEHQKPGLQIQATTQNNSFGSFTKKINETPANKTHNISKGISAVRGQPVETSSADVDDTSPLPYAGRPFVIDPRTKIRFAPASQRSIQKFLSTEYESLTTKISPFKDISVANRMTPLNENISVVGVLVAKYYPKHGHSLKGQEGEGEGNSATYGIIKLWNGKGSSLHVGQNTSNPNILSLIISGAAFSSIFARLTPSSLIIIINPQLSANNGGEEKKSEVPLFRCSAMGSIILAGRAIDFGPCGAQVGQKGNSNDTSKPCTVMVNTLAKNCPYHTVGAANKEYTSALASIKGSQTKNTTCISTVTVNNTNTVTAKGLRSVFVPPPQRITAKQSTDSATANLKQSLADQASTLLGISLPNGIPSLNAANNSVTATFSHSSALQPEENFICTKGFKMVNHLNSSNPTHAANAHLLKHRSVPLVPMSGSELIIPAQQLETGQGKLQGDIPRCPRGTLLLTAAVEAQTKEKLRLKLEETKRLAATVSGASKRQREETTTASLCSSSIKIQSQPTMVPSTFFVRNSSHTASVPNTKGCENPTGLPQGAKVLLPSLSRPSAFSPLAGNVTNMSRSVASTAAHQSMANSSDSPFVATALSLATGGSNIIALAKASSSIHAEQLVTADWDRRMETVEKIVRVEKAIEALDAITEIQGVSCFRCNDCNTYYSSPLDSCKAKQHYVEPAVAVKRFYECVICQRYRISILEAPDDASKGNTFSTITSGNRATFTPGQRLEQKPTRRAQNCPICKQQGVWRKCSAAPVPKDCL